MCLDMCSVRPGSVGLRSAGLSSAGLRSAGLSGAGLGAWPGVVAHVDYRDRAARPESQQQRFGLW